MPSASRSDATRAALIRAGLRLFGRDGFGATSTRALAAEAGANVAAIAYHFGGKEGLRRACAEHFARTILATVASSVPPEEPGSPAAETARAQLHRMLDAMVAFVVGSETARDLAGFMLRELAEDGPGVDAVYGALIEPMHGRVCRLWAAATGQDAGSDHTRLSVFAFIGQIVYFRIGQPVVARRMGWPRPGPMPVAAIAAVLSRNLDTLLDADRMP